MKTRLPSLALACATALPWLSPSTLTAADKVPPPPPATPPPPDLEVEVETSLDRENRPNRPPRPPRPARPPANADLQEIENAARLASEEAGRAMREVERRLSGMRFGYSGPSANRSLILPAPGSDPAQVGQIREELAVMSRILTRVANPETDPGHRPLFNLEFGPAVWGNPSGLDALYLDGYGAVFIVPVKHPLVAPPRSKPDSDGKAQPSTRDETWERTRRELAGDPDEPAETDAPPSSFDPDRVAQLQRDLTTALRHAANLKCVKTGETVTVMVLGRPGPSPAPGAPGRRNGHPGTLSIEPGPAGVGGTSVLTLRASRADIDALRAGSLDEPAFARRVQVESRMEPAPGRPPRR